MEATAQCRGAEMFGQEYWGGGESSETELGLDPLPPFAVNETNLRTRCDSRVHCANVKITGHSELKEFLDAVL